jgi:membrane-associated phospholipid phosphatase
VHDADQFAAMPSLHIAWAVWSAVGVWCLTRRKAIRALAVAYPILTCFVVLGTGNHYLLDVVAGAVTVAVAFALQTALAAALAAVRRRRSTPAREHTVSGVPAQP